MITIVLKNKIIAHYKLSEFEVTESSYDAIGGVSNLSREQRDMYFDYEAYGRDIALDSSGGFSSYGYVEIPF